MIDRIKYLSIKLGINKTIAFTLLSKLLQAGGGVLTLLFIIKFLTDAEQGYYYTFGSILAIQIFFELGFSAIITQYVAHENAHLNWTSEFFFDGSEKIGSRLSSLLRFTIKWFSIISSLLFVGLLISGYVYFERFGLQGKDVDWWCPWIILSITTSLSLLSSPILAFFEGLGKIKEVARLRLYQQIIQLSLVILFFITGFKLYAAPIAALIAFSAVPIWIFTRSRFILIKFIWYKLDEWKIDYWTEIFPFQWKIALSWISGYFIFQLFNPVIFAVEGPEAAGQMGMTLTVLNAIFVLVISWMTTKLPIYSELIAKKDYIQLDILFSRTLKQSIFINLLGLISLITIIAIVGNLNLVIWGKNISQSFLPFYPLLFMSITIFLNHILSSWAIYMRCHKKEPMLVQSIIIGVMCCVSTLSLGSYFGTIGVTIGYLVITCISFVWTYLIFITKKKEWHE